jgi:hypothetical protein
MRLKNFHQRKQALMDLIASFLSSRSQAKAEAISTEDF